MIARTQAIVGKTLYWSDMADRSYTVIRVRKVLPQHGKHFSVEAEIVNNTHLDGRNYEWNKVGSIHTYGNSFLYTSFAHMKAGAAAYKKVQIAFVERMFVNATRK